MAGSSFGTIFTITTWGESHGPALGVVVDGCPAGLPLSAEDIQPYLDRRRPGQSAFTTQRNEADSVRILSGIYEGVTTGTPISMMIENTDQHSSDYGELAYTYRPGHADYTFDQKFGVRDPRGGGRSSGRETVGRVAAGAIAAKLLSTMGITVSAYTASIGQVSVDPARFDLEEARKNPHYMPDALAAKKADMILEKARTELNSVGSSVECIVTGLPAGIGNPVFDKLDAKLAQALMSIGAVKAVEVGDGIAVSSSSGSLNNDPFRSENGEIKKTANHAGGTLGGISDGSELILHAYFKPTPSIAQPQNTVTKDGKEVSLSIKGRHDPVIGPRAVVVVEAMTAITILDLMMTGASAKLSNLQKIYS